MRFFTVTMLLSLGILMMGLGFCMEEFPKLHNTTNHSYSTSITDITETSNTLTTGNIDVISQNSWINLTPDSAPINCVVHSAVWANDKMYIFGGNDHNDVELENSFNELWEYEPSQNRWVKVDAISPPSARHWHSAVWTGEEIIVFGGSNGDGITNNETWVYSFDTNTWINKNPINPPSNRCAHKAVWTGEEMIIFGGFVPTYLNDTWKYDLDANQWTNLNPDSPPSSRHSYAAGWTGEKFIIFGGSTGYTYLDETWEYDPIANTWTNLNPSSKPSDRAGPVGTWMNNSMIIFGGSRNWGSTILDETWKYDYTNNTWINLNPDSPPEGRTGHSLIWTGTKILLFGGWIGNETWEYLP